MSSIPVSVRALSSGLLVLAAALGVAAAAADEYSVAPVGPPPSDELSADIVKLLDDKGTAVKDGSRTLMELWLVKEWPLKSATPEGQLLYPFEVGQLIGAVRYTRKGADFRDQEIVKGVYTLRYAQQPVDGSHVGTSPTRDFLLLIEASKDTSPETLVYKPLTDLSKEAAQSAHPALLCMQRAEAAGQPVRHQEEHDWRIVRLEGQGKSPEGTKPLPIEFVVVGQAAE
jgi:hypothetical protein